MHTQTILVVEDDAQLREALVETLQLADLNVLAAGSGEQALQQLARQQVELIVTDVNMPGMSGMDLLTEVRAAYPMVPVLLMTAYGSIEHSVAAMQQGAADYLVKPFAPESLVATVKKNISASANFECDTPVAEEQSSRQLLKLASRVAVSDATVLITGESGTGKEVLARYIHSQSTRASGPFVAINCAAIPENMLEATLFGYEKGAFTGAVASNAGKFEQADGGTILLDEISEMDTGLQAKILRVLQEREVERLGGKKTLHLNVRVIATSNRDLQHCVREGVFREDLYYRLNVLPLAWLPLRQRRLDIAPLARRLLASHAGKMGRHGVTLDATAEQAIMNHSWPGNVRELDNTIQRAMVMQDGNTITAMDLTLGSGCPGWSLPTFAITDEQSDEFRQEAELGQAEHEDMLDPGLLGNDLKQREFEIILSTLRENGGKRKKTAEVLGISARTLRYKMARIRESGINIEHVMGA